MSKQISTFQRSGRRAFTIVEVVIAMALLVILAFGTMASLMFASRASRINTNSIAAKNIAQGFFEQMAIADFGTLNSVSRPNISENDDPPVFLDEDMDIRCSVEFVFNGWGVLTAATRTALTDTRQNWAPNEWAGDYVFIVEGRGAGQYARVASNTANTLYLDGSLDVTPGTDSFYLMNNGITVEITTSWSYLGRRYSETIESLVPNYRNDDLALLKNIATSG